jgi:hypothetical protein
MLTKRHFAGPFPVVGALNPHTLVFRSPDGRLHTAGKSFEADYVVESIVCRKGAPSSASVRTVDMSNQLLAQLSSLVDSTEENYFFGDVATIDKVSLPENIKLFSPITGSGGAIKLNFATLSDIREYNLEFAFVTKGLLTIKTISPLRPARSGDTLNLSLPRFDNFAQLSYLITARDSLKQLVAKGDTLHKGDLMALKINSSFFDQEISLNAQKLTELENDREVSLQDFDRKIAEAEIVVALDSSEYRHTQELVTSNYLPWSVLIASELKYRKGVKALQKAVSARSQMARKTTREISALHLKDLELRAKARTARLQSEIRSPIHGILLEVRQLPQDNNTRLVFIIRRTSL